ncbi:MAG: EF-hand domain-containing protein [Paracoccaceae bacterium]
MIDKNKVVGATLVALAVAFAGGAAMADRGDRMGGAEGPMFGMDFAAIDADKDGKITQAEIDAYRAAQAKAFDTDGDGLLSAEELSAMHLQNVTARASDRAARMIERMDTDGDGKLSAAEMAVRPMAGRMFDRLDADKDGALSEAELAAARDRMTERRGDKRGEKHGEKRGGMQRGHHGGQGNN